MPQLKSLAGGGGEDEAFLRDSFAGGGDSHERGGACLGDGAHCFFDDVGEAAFFIAGGGVGLAVGAASCEIGVVPGHFADEVACDLGRCCARGDEVRGVADFSDLRE